MLKISAHISKKVPLPERQYSSQQYGASLEIEVSDASKPEDVQQRLRQLYSIISRTIDEQIGQAANGQAKPAAAAPTAARSNGTGNGTNGVNGHTVAASAATQPRSGAMATQAQQRAIHALSKRAGLDVGAAVSEHGVSDPADLSVRQASALIDSLKARSGAA